MRKQYFLLILLTILVPLLTFGQKANRQVLDQLQKAIDSADIYDKQKFDKINSLQTAVNATSEDDLNSRYSLILKLYYEYRIFRFDSAFYYAKKLREVADHLNDPVKKTEADTKLAFILISAGLYYEAEEVMNRIDINNMPPLIRAEYFLTRGRFYYDLADYAGDHFFYPKYFQQAGSIIDSALQIYPPSSFQHSYYSGLKKIKVGDMVGAFNNLHEILRKPSLTHHEIALTTSTLSFVYFMNGLTDSAIYYQALAAMADVRSSTKETFAVLNLSQLLFSGGDFNRASEFIRKAVDDAAFYGARQRKIQAGGILPIIQASEISLVKKQRRLWIIYGAIVSFFLIVFVFLLITIRKQNRKLHLAKQQISDAHQALHAVNDKLLAVNEELIATNSRLTEVNSRLEEANRIKEEYVGYFFTLDAEFFQKMERFKKAIEEKIHYGKFNEIKYIVNDINIRYEREELVKSFDKAFLKLFPRFVDEFNSLFDEENQVRLEEGELLNTDLRIYALLRLGIKENEKIAEILQYSVKSIYAYKTRIRNRSKYPRDEFDKKVSQISSGTSKWDQEPG